MTEDNMGDSVTRIVKGGFWLYASSIVNNISGFFYWLILSWIAGSSILGITSATVGIANLIIGLLSLGIGTGLNHFLGGCIGRKDLLCFRRYFWTAIQFSALLYASTGGILVILGTADINLFNLTPEMLTYAGFLVTLGIVPILQAAVVSTLKTEILFVATVLGNVSKIVVGILLVDSGWGFKGAIIGYAFMSIMIIVVAGTYTIKYVEKIVIFSLSTLKRLIKGSIVSWLPSIILLAGQWIGVLVVFGSTDEVETGHYYVAFTISNFVFGIAIMMIGLLLPVLSGMSDGRKVAASRVLRLSLAIMVPVAAFIAAYPWLPLSFLGREYVDASASLTVLLLGSVPLAVYSAVNSLVYSYKRYLDVLYLGLSQNVPRLVLYFALVPVLRGLGAAISFTVGAFTGLVHAAFLARRVGFKVGWGGIGKAIGVPALFMVVAYFAGLPWPVALVFTAVSYLLYGRLGILRREDVRDLAHALLGEELAARVYERTRWLVDYIFG